MTTYNLTSTTPSNLITGDIIICPYSGTIKTITLPIGEYYLECWGANGGRGNSTSYLGGMGGYSKGILKLSSSLTLYLVVGGAGAIGSSTSTYAGGYNGGGMGRYYSGGGGGATHIAKVTGLLSTLSSSKSNILMVAGGGGGAAYTYGKGGAGGGARGENGEYNIEDISCSTYYGTGGAQNVGGKTLNNIASCAGTFGTGGPAYTNYAGGGGAGLYGGAGGYQYAAGGGGSGYINYDLLLNGSTLLKESSTPDSSGNGYIKITCNKINSNPGIYIKVNGEWIKTF